MHEISKELIADIQQCQICNTIIGYKKFPTTSHGQLKGKYLLVSEAPGKESLFKKQYWMGAGGKILRSCAAKANTSLENLFYLTDIVKCWPNENENNRTPFESEIQKCSHFLIKEVNELKPKLIVSFGGIASSFLLKRPVKIKKEHGCVCSYNKNTNILILLHPTGIDRQMKRDIYIKQLTTLFLKLKQGKHDEIDILFR